mgnify:CR=1 FL=1|tara:strand:+ start:16784 stop:17818 length:1035 start_codon:yes stop_codon:yes gene_type:complete
MIDRLTVFISYSWDSPEHKDWVLKLANYLTEKAGCNVLLDQYDLAAGKELTHFMENGLEKADKVIIILTEDYKKRADNRQGGTGFEYSLISQGLYDLQAKNNKFIPILRQGTKETSAPIYLATKIYHSMKDDLKFEIDAFALSREIYEKPEVVRPELGDRPDFNDPDYDPIVAVANELSSKESINRELDNLLDSVEGVMLARKEIDFLFSTLSKKAEEYNEKTDFNFKVEKNPRETSSLVMSLGYTVTFESHINARNTVRYSELVVKMWNGYTPINQHSSFHFPSDRPKLKAEMKYTVDFKPEKQVVWRVDESLTIKSKELIQDAFVFIMQSIQDEKERKFRKD